MKLNFHHWDTLLSKTIRFCSNGNFNHVSIESGLFIYEAHIHTGVRKVLRSEWDDSTVYTTIEFDEWPKREARMVEWLERQVWKKYDIIGVLSFIWIFLREKKGKWYCSELWMCALMKLLGVWKDEYNQKQSPTDLYHLCLILKHCKR